MYSAIFGFHLLVWCPKWTPASRSCLMVTTDILVLLSFPTTVSWRPVQNFSDPRNARPVCVIAAVFFVGRRRRKRPRIIFYHNPPLFSRGFTDCLHIYFPKYSLGDTPTISLKDVEKYV